MADPYQIINQGIAGAGQAMQTQLLAEIQALQEVARQQRENELIDKEHQMKLSANKEMAQFGNDLAIKRDAASLKDRSEANIAYVKAAADANDEVAIKRENRAFTANEEERKRRMPAVKKITMSAVARMAELDDAIDSVIAEATGDQGKLNDLTKQFLTSNDKLQQSDLRQLIQDGQINEKALLEITSPKIRKRLAEALQEARNSALSQIQMEADSNGGGSILRTRLESLNKQYSNAVNTYQEGILSFPEILPDTEVFMKELEEARKQKDTDAAAKKKDPYNVDGLLDAAKTPEPQGTTPPPNLPDPTQQNWNPPISGFGSLLPR
jgi:ribosomal protein L19E